MIKNKKGLSDIVITLLIVVLSLVAIGGVWFVVRNVLNTGSQGVDVAAKCLRVSVEATKVTCTNPADPALNKLCTVTLSKTGSDEIDGVKLAFKNQETGAISSQAVDVEGDVPLAVGKIGTNLDTYVAKASSLTSVEVTPYFTDDSGNLQLCSQKTSFSFVAE